MLFPKIVFSKPFFFPNSGKLEGREAHTSSVEAALLTYVIKDKGPCKTVLPGNSLGRGQARQAPGPSSCPRTRPPPP